MQDYFQQHRVELFNVWMDSGKSWDQCQLHCQRKQSHKNQSEKGWTAIKGRDLKQQMSEEKFATLVKSRMASGLYYDDDDFPDDEEEFCLTWSSYLFVPPKIGNHKTSFGFMPSPILIHKSPSQERWFWMRAASSFKQKD